MAFPSQTPIKRNLEIWQDVNATPFVQIENLTKEYGDFTAVKNVSLSIYKGELFSLLGGSGCGKTTLLRMLAGFEKPSSGRIFLDGADITDVPSHERPVNMMFQSYALFPHMSVYQNVAFGLKQEKMANKVIDELVRDTLSLVKLSGFEDRKPNQLSGGQRQRVALARSLVKRPKLLLLDEPLAALDKKLKEHTQFELVNIQERVGVTFVVVTHDQEEAMTISTRMAIMNDGKIAQVGGPHDVYEFPNSKFVAEFIGSVNMFNGIVIEEGPDYLVIESPELDSPIQASQSGVVPIGSSVTLAIRPEKIMISTSKPSHTKNWCKGTVKEIAYLGDVSIYYIEVTSGKIVMVTLPNLLRLADRNVQWDDVVYLFWRTENGAILTA